MGQSNLDLAELTELGHHLPERSGQKTETTRRIVAVFQANGCDQIVTGLGGHRVAAIFDGLEPGPCVMFRSDPHTNLLPAKAAALAIHVAAQGGLRLASSHHDMLRACTDAADAINEMQRAMDKQGIPHEPGYLPLRVSEDFSLYGDVSKSAMRFMGAGGTHPMLHNPTATFPWNYRDRCAKFRPDSAGSAG